MGKISFFVGLFVLVILFFVAYISDSVEWALAAIGYLLVFIVLSIILSIEHDDKTEKAMLDKFFKVRVGEVPSYSLKYRSFFDLLLVRFSSFRVFLFLVFTFVFVNVGLYLHNDGEVSIYTMLGVIPLIFVIAVGPILLSYLIAAHGRVKYAFSDNYVYMVYGVGRTPFLFLSYKKIISYSVENGVVILDIGLRSYKLINLKHDEIEKVRSILESKVVR